MYGSNVNICGILRVCDNFKQSWERFGSKQVTVEILI